MGEDRIEEGMRVRREVLGDDHVDRAVAATTPFSADFQRHLTGVAWADVWTRERLDRRTRSQLTLALLAALGHDEELALHVRAAVGLGLTAADIAEVLLHTSVYAGIPAANSAMRVAQRSLAELGVEDALPPTSPHPDADEMSP
jgi:4-carboxymuconolactone decarboxylase